MLYQKIRRDIENILSQYANVIETSAISTLTSQIHEKVQFDLREYCKRDPAAKNAKMVYFQYASFKAIFIYRIANAILNYAPDKEIVQMIARELSERARSFTGVEIHPNARIGYSFVIDHGIGVVIGETTEIGNNCYFLHNVVLGSRGIADNPEGKRHPTIGNNVQIGNNTSILGNIHIGCNTFIGPLCRITSDVPTNSKISVGFRMQEMVYNASFNRHIKVHNIYPIHNGSAIIIEGENLDIPLLECTVSYGREIEEKASLISIRSKDLIVKMNKYCDKAKMLCITLSQDGLPILSLYLTSTILS